MSGLRVRIDNPYSTGFLVKLADDERALYRNKIKHTPSPKDIYHMVTYSDRLDTLAFQYYRNSKYWWIIADVNDVLNPFELTVGQTLIIPDLDLIKAYVL